MEDKTKIRLTAAEMAGLWTQYINDTVAVCVNSYFLEKVVDGEARPLIEWTLDTAKENISIMQDLFNKRGFLPAPMSWDSAVSDTTTSVFSDKLMMYHVAAMIAAGIGNFGMALAVSPRRDIGLKYASLIPEIALYAEDGANIMIKNGWMEEPPQAADRDQLIQN